MDTLSPKRRVFGARQQGTLRRKWSYFFRLLSSAVITESQFWVTLAFLAPDIVSQLSSTIQVEMNLTDLVGGGAVEGVDRGRVGEPPAA